MEEIRYIEPAALRKEMLRLRNEEKMDFLESLTGMDWGVPAEDDAPGTRRGLGVVYHLESTETHERTALQTSTLDREHPELPTVSDIWKTAKINEREVYDFFGIVFVGHTDMRRLFLRNDWNGYPLRKDDDPEKENPLRMDNEETVDDTTEIELNPDRSEEHTSELQSPDHLVCRLLLEKKKHYNVHLTAPRTSGRHPRPVERA